MPDNWVGEATCLPAGTAQQNYYLTISNPTPAPTYLFTDGFESGTLGAWNGVTSDIVVQSSIVHSGTYAAQIHYPAGSADINRFLRFNFSPQGTHYFIRGYVYFPTPLVGQCGQRKMYYFKTTDVNNVSSGAGYSTFYVLTSNQADGYSSQLKLYEDIGGYGGGTGGTFYSATTLNHNQWYSIEFEVKLNDLGFANGYVNVWIDGVLIADLSHSGLQPMMTPDIFDHIEVGRQFDPYDCSSLAPLTTSDENRYWDDVIINNTGPIGP